jgi:hypothetical protein
LTKKFDAGSPFVSTRMRAPSNRRGDAGSSRSPSIARGGANGGRSFSGPPDRALGDHDEQLGVRCAFGRSEMGLGHIRLRRFTGRELGRHRLAPERFARVEDWLAMPAAHKTAVRLALRLLQPEDGFAMRAARCEEHGEPDSQRA